VWNIVEAYLDESGLYPCVTAENIPRVQQPDRFLFNKLGRFGPPPENPRVGGSIPPLATIKIKFLNQGVASESINLSSNMSAAVQYFGPLFA
jgi:hypothetical protein